MDPLENIKAVQNSQHRWGLPLFPKTLVNTALINTALVNTALIMAVLFNVTLFNAPAWAQLGDACIVEDNGTGTVTVPPAGCDFRQPQEVYKIIDGLPPGTTIELTGTHLAFHCNMPASNGPCLVENGGLLGGQRELWDAVMVFELRGTGDLADFRRVLSFEVTAETQSAPRTPGDPVQGFDTGLASFTGSLPAGDPDFAQLQLDAGFDFPAGSFGHTILTSRGDGTFHVERFFHITYRITFQGAPGGALDGLAGMTERTTRIQSRGVRPEGRCIVPDNGSGTTTLPLDGCGYISPLQNVQIFNGLPGGSLLQLEPRLEPFVCTLPGGVCGEPGGTLGGEREVFDSVLRFYLEGTGALSGFRRALRVPVTIETHSAPRVPGDPVQAFVIDVFDLQGTLTGDPDFASLTITGGSNHGFPSPGHTTLQDLGDGSFQADSFFDLEYEIEFTGASGGALAGLSGTTTARVRMEARHGKANAVEGDNGSGTVTLPPESGEYRSPNDHFSIIDGLPPGTSIEVHPNLGAFFCTSPGCGESGGALGGEREIFDATLDLVLEGDGSLPGFQRTLSLPVTVETHTAPRTPGDPMQTFATDLFHLQGTLVGDPDFSLLTLTAGSDNGLASPGSATLTDLGDGTFQVDSFFDITYEIEFEGAPGSPLDGLSGTTQGTVRIEACEREGALPHNVTIVQVTEPQGPADTSFTGDLGTFSLDDDADPTLSDRRTINNLTPGAFSVLASVPPDLVLLGIVCDDPDGGTTVDVATGEANIDLDLGEELTCVFRSVESATLLFADGFESGSTAAWSQVAP